MKYVIENPPVTGRLYSDRSNDEAFQLTRLTWIPALTMLLITLHPVTTTKSRDPQRFIEAKALCVALHVLH